jgi:hypothetical protein
MKREASILRVGAVRRVVLPEAVIEARERLAREHAVVEDQALCRPPWLEIAPWATQSQIIWYWAAFESK